MTTVIVVEDDPAFLTRFCRIVTGAADLYLLAAVGDLASARHAIARQAPELSEPIGMGVPKGRDAAAAAYVGRFVEAAKAEGLVKSAIERAGMRGVVVAPLT